MSSEHVLNSIAGQALTGVLKKEFKFIREMYLDGSIWSVGYFVSTIGLNEEMIKRYIAQQGRKDLGWHRASRILMTRKGNPVRSEARGRGGGHSRIYSHHRGIPGIFASST